MARVVYLPYPRRRSRAGPLVALAAFTALMLVTGHGPHAPKAAAPARTAAATQAAPAVGFARSKVGGGYLWGGNGPADYDCSGLVTAAWARAGLAIPRTAAAEWHGLRHVSVRHLRPGDLLFYAGSDGTWADPGHVAMFIGHDRMVEAYSIAVGIRATPVRWGGLIGAARP